MKLPVISLRQIRCLSQKSIEKLRPIPVSNLFWKANEDDPTKHTREHESLLYQLPMDRLVQLFGDKPFKKERHKFYKAIDMMPIMIREPSLKTIDYLKKVDFANQPNLRILLYGDRGQGKTNVLTHLIHYLQAVDDHIIIHVRDMKKFTLHPAELEDSTTRKGRLDTPLDAAILLQKFKTMNMTRLEKLSGLLVSSQDYKWSVREETKKGDPLISIAEHGINRINHASDCFAVLCKELMLAADQGLIKLASAMDNVQFLYWDVAYNLKHSDKKRAYVDEITVSRALKKLIVNQQKGSVVLATCDDKMSNKQNQLPHEVIGEKGWIAFDPCLPINVPKYSRKEYESYMNFLQDVGWLQRPESCTFEGRDEIRFNSGQNPGELSYLCQAL